MAHSCLLSSVSMSSVSSSSVFVPITDKSLHQMKIRTFYLNSRTDAGRRNEIEWRLEQAGLEARRFAVPAWEDVERVMKRRQEARRLLNGLAQDAPATIDYARALGMRPETQTARRKTQDARATSDNARALGMSRFG
jgi:hypothetical protein